MSEDIRESVRKVLDGFDAGVFIRDASHDDEPGWAMRTLPYLMALGKLAKWCDPDPASEGRGRADG